MLTEFIKTNKLSVVISSSHRKHYVGPEYLRKYLGEIVDYIHPHWKTHVDSTGFRGNEIKAWVDSHPEITSYVILDDYDDFYEFQPLAQTSMRRGLTSSDLLVATSLLESTLVQNFALMRDGGICIINGDLLNTRSLIIAHGCNAQGRMRSGVAKIIREQHPKAYDSYYERFTTKGLNLGDVVWVMIDDHYNDKGHYRWVANAITQEHYGYDGKSYVNYDAIYNALHKIAIDATNMHVYEIAIPKIGAGLGGGDWVKIKQILTQISQQTRVVFTVFILNGDTA